MRRYGGTQYGGFAGKYTPRIQPGSFPDVPTADMPVLPTPADIRSRRPGKLLEGGGAVLPFFRSGKLPPMGDLDPKDFVALLLDEIQKKARSYTNYDALRYASFNNIPLIINVADAVILDRATDIRVYLFIVNTHPANTLFLTFKTTSTAINGVPLAPGNGFFEFNNIVPQDSVHLIASAAGTTGVLLYGEMPASRLTQPPGYTVT